MANLTSYTVAEFKSMFGIVTIDIILNPKTGLLFAATDSPNMTNLVVSKTYDKALPKQIMHIEASDDKEEIYILCNTNLQERL